jgi:DNA-3-methyladenine glycosylase
MHHCLNVVTRGVGIAEAILIRAVVPTRGLAAMRARRELSERAPAFRIARGPANLCKAFGIDRALNGVDLTGSTLTIRRSRLYASSEVRHTPRIGIDYAGEYVGKRWRLCVREEPAVSGRR